MKTEDGEIVPGPVWNAEFNVTDENDNPPSIQENSKLHAMEESIRKGDSLPEKSFMNNPSNGYIKIVDPDDQDSDSMRLVSTAECVFPMVIVSILPHADFGSNDHRKDAPHFRILIF